MIVAIDGPAGSGKSSVAHAIAERCKLTFLDTGAMYRAVAVECERQGIELESDKQGIIDVAKSCSIEFGSDENRQTVIINGFDVSDEIRTPHTDKSVSLVAVIPEVRAALVERQQKYAEHDDVIAEGRDIGTVVFPHADVKVFLTADDRARALRRAVQREGKDTAKDKNATADEKAVEEILADIRRRDKVDSTRKASPLRPAEDAVTIDSSELTLEEVVTKIIELDERLKERACQV